jgi:hypothetical protein
MKTANTVRLAALFSSLVSSIAFAQQGPVPSFFEEVSKTVGKSGTLNADGSFRINIPRRDVQFTHASGMPIDADLGLSTYIAFNGTEEKALAVGDIAMLEGEIDGVIDRLRAGGFEIVALHNHMTTEEPRLFFLHFQVTGKPSDLAVTFRKAVDHLGKGGKRPVLKKQGKPKINADALTSVFGVKPQIFPSGVVRFANPRKDISVSVDGQSFLPGMGLASWAAFYACECGQTMVMGDTCATRADLQRVLDALRNGGLHITAIHNHILGGSREVIFLHYEGEGDAAKLAESIKACWKVLGDK